LDRPTANLRVNHDNDRVTITISNPLGPECDLAAIREALGDYRQQAEALPNSRLVKGEGRSGFAKMHKIIQFDLRCIAYTIDPVIIEGREFHVNITMQFQGAKDASIGR
jgi:hypothetical protein